MIEVCAAITPCNAGPPTISPLLAPPLPSSAATSSALNHSVTALVLRALSHVHPRHWGGVISATISLGWPDKEVRQAAAEAVISALALDVVGAGPGAHPSCFLHSQEQQNLARFLLVSFRGGGSPDGPWVLLQPYRFTEEELWEAEPLQMDLWLVAAAAGPCLGMECCKLFQAEYVLQSEGWGALKGWSLGYLRDRRAVTVERGLLWKRRELRLWCVRVLAKELGRGVGALSRSLDLVDFSQLWLNDWDMVEEGRAGSEGAGVGQGDGLCGVVEEVGALKAAGRQVLIVSAGAGRWLLVRLAGKKGGCRCLGAPAWEAGR